MSVRSRDESLTNLAHSAQEVDNALASFMNERTRAVNAQSEAMKLYDAEMLHIMKEVEDEQLRVRHSAPSTAVDHNILRSINATGDEPGEHKLVIEDDSLLEGSRRSSLDSKVGFNSSLLTVPAGNVGAGAAKKPTPSQAERLNIRKEMLTFFEGSRDSEIDQFNALDELLGGDEPKKTVEAVENLFQEQTMNFGLLMNFLDEYQPEPFVKAWGNDPDYKKLTKKYAIKKSDQSYKARATLATMKHKSAHSSSKKML